MDLTKITSLTPQQAHRLHELYRGEWWTQERRLEDVLRMLAHAEFVFGYCEPESHELVAFARVISDRVFKALLLDVIVDPPYRARGLGERLVRDVREHPELSGVRHLELYCLPELAPFYERLGFSQDTGGLVFMRQPLED